MINRILTVLLLLVSGALILVGNVSAATVPGAQADCATNPNAILTRSEFTGYLPTSGCASDDPVLQTILKFASGITATLSILFVAIGAVRYTFSGGDSNAIASAKKTIMYALIGLALGVSAFTIVSYVLFRVSS